MKITICGSIAFKKEMTELKNQLKKLGHEVQEPPAKVYNAAGEPISVQEDYQIRKSASPQETWVWQRKAEAIHKHFDKIDWCDVILVANYDKNDVAGYIGANTLLEMGLAFYLKKKIYLLKPVPEISYQEEILGLQPTVIDGNLSLIK